MAENANIIRATLPEMYKRKVSYSDRDKDKMYLSGENNLYPNEIDLVVKNSPTAYRAHKVMTSFIKGKGYYYIDELGNEHELDYEDFPVILQSKGYRYPDIVELGAKSLSAQNGVYFHVMYGLEDDGEKLVPVPRRFDVLPYFMVRKSKEDDMDFEGMYLYGEFDTDDKGFRRSKKDYKKLYPFNRNYNVVMAQIKKDAKLEDDDFDLTEAIKRYRGQVFYLNLDPDQVYASSRMDAVYNDADTEYRAGLYYNMQSRTGFLGKTVVITQGLTDEKAKEVTADLADFLGADNSGSMYHVDALKADSLDNVLKVIQLKPQIEADLFEGLLKGTRQNILGVFNNLHEALAFSNSGTLNSASGDALEQYKLAYSENTSYEREKLERALFHIGLNYRGNMIKIRPILTSEEIDNGV